MNDLAKQIEEDKPLRTNPKFIDGFGIVCFSISASTLIGAIYLAYVFKDALGNATDKGPLWLAALPQILAIVGGSFAGFIWSRSWIQKQEINDQKVLELANQKLALEDRQKEFEHQKLESEKNRQIADTQFNARLLADQHQFQSNKLEDRFNRILDDFASEDDASRAGAASRFVSIAQALEPGLDGGVPLTEKSNPYYMPSVRQLSQRLVMEENKRVCKAIQDALRELSQWTSKEAEKRKDEEPRRAYDEMQAKLTHELADVNRAAYIDWLEVLARYIHTQVTDSELNSPEYEGNDLPSTLLAIFSEEGSDGLPRAMNWTGTPAIDNEAHKVFLDSEHFKNAYWELDYQDEGQLVAELKLSTMHLAFARDALADVLRTLPAPANLPEGIDADWTTWNRDVSINLIRCFLIGAQLYRANLQKVFLNRANLQRANLEHSNLQGARLQISNLHGAHLSMADLRYSHLRSANLERADLMDSNMQYAQIQRAKLKGAHLESALVYASKLNLAESLPESALEAEFRKDEYNYETQNHEIPDRPLSSSEKAHYDSVRKVLIRQGTITENHVGPHDIEGIELVPSVELSP